MKACLKRTVTDRHAPVRKASRQKRLGLKDNIQSTWKLIGSLIDRTNNNFQILIKNLLCDNRIYSYEVIYEMFHILNC